MSQITTIQTMMIQKSKDRNTLGVKYDSSPSEIKDSYLKLVNKYHPDNKGGDVEKFTKVNEAYKRLEVVIRNRERFKKR